MAAEIWTGSGQDCNSYDFTVSGTGGTGNPCQGGGISIACDPANNHSGGIPAVLTATGSFAAADAQELWASKLYKYSVGGLKKAIKTVGEKFCRGKKEKEKSRKKAWMADSMER